MSLVSKGISLCLSYFTYKFSSTYGIFISNSLCSFSSLLSAILMPYIYLIAYFYTASWVFFIAPCFLFFVLLAWFSSSSFAKCRLHQFLDLHIIQVTFTCLLCYIQFH